MVELRIVRYKTINYKQGNNNPEIGTKEVLQYREKIQSSHTYSINDILESSCFCTEWKDVPVIDEADAND